MFNKIFFKIILEFLINLFFYSQVFSETINEIKISGNERVPGETIKIFSKVSIDDNLNQSDLNEIVKNLYETNYFELIDVKFEKNILNINVKENPIIYNLLINGVKSKSLIGEIKNLLELKERMPFLKPLIDKENQKLNLFLRKKGYFFSNVKIFKEELNDNRVDIIIDIDLGKKTKIKKMSFVGDKKFKNNKLLSIIVSEEFKIWKFISNKKF